MFKYLLLASSLLIALCAAYFSVSGIASLFAGRYYSVIIMASALEVGKLVGASYLYRYWANTVKVLKTYMVVGVAALMLITSVGIYGYLSSAYAAVAASPQQTMTQLSAIESQIQTVNDNIDRWKGENSQLQLRQQQAQKTLDAVLAGNTKLNQRSAFSNLRQEIVNLDNERARNAGLIQSAQQQLVVLESERIRLSGELNNSGKIGQFVYVARALNVPLDSIVKWFVLLLVFVFDPMAISLILAYNAIVKRESVESSTKERMNNKSTSITSAKATDVPKSWIAPDKKIVEPSKEPQNEQSVSTPSPIGDIEKHYGVSRG
jgi:hypothetical protein